MDKFGAEQLLQRMLANPAASFREGQWEAIDTLVNHGRKLLVVQRTGWGKSAVYFISTKIFRDRGMGPTIIVSPLLALMRNQVLAAERLGIRAETLNSTNRDEWLLITRQLVAGELDCLLISPERLANQDFIQTVLAPVGDRISMLVVDEAHCISDWGHDFRPDYRRILDILRQLPANTPVLGTTATANQRVVADIQQQIGDIVIQRGTLSRKSLALDVLTLRDQPSRLAWLASTIPEFPGAGIVYTLTTRDADLVAQWLRQNAINAQAYYSGVVHPGFNDTNATRQYLENALQGNELKVLVATTALGMGYDKPDLSFVIHYQAPGSIVGYYQQVGRAGRGIDHAAGILLTGEEDSAIHDYFRQSAFPTQSQIAEVLQVLESSDGLTLRDIEARTNLRYGQIEKTIKLLSVEYPSPVLLENRRWYRTAVPFAFNQQRIDHLTRQRETEWQEVRQYIATDECKMAFIQRALDEPTTERCGQCSSCQTHHLLDYREDRSLIESANLFLQRADLPLILNRQVAAGAFSTYGFQGNFPDSLRAEEGRVLSRWGDSGWGAEVARDKHRGYFSDSLVAGLAEMISDRWAPNPPPSWVCCAPSLQHPELVPDFARRLAQFLELPFVDVIVKVRDNQPQKLQQNRYHQCQNLDGVFQVSSALPNGPVLLVDDIIDSGWTMTVLAALLRQAGCEKVYPVALASTSVKNG